MTQCPNCDIPLKTVPAGVSKKSGKAYPPFLSCTNRECSYTENIDPVSYSPPVQNTPSEPKNELLNALREIYGVMCEQRNLLKELTKK